MRIVVRIILLLALIALGVWLWIVFFPSPEKIVRSQLAKLAQDVSFSQDENGIIKMAHAQSVADFFSTNIEINVDVPGHGPVTLDDRAQITQMALASRQQFSSIDIKFPDINVTVAPDKNSATADVTVDITISGERDTVVQEVKFTYQKIDGHWLITKVETVKTVS
jgi:hypothetical protein